MPKKISSFSADSGTNIEEPIAVLKESSSSINPYADVSMMELVIKNIEDLGKIRDDVSQINNKIKKYNGFIDSSLRLNKMIFWIILLLPIAQISIVGVILFFIEPQGIFTSFIKWILGLMGIATVVELCIIPVQLFNLRAKVKEMEDKINN